MPAHKCRCGRWISFGEIPSEHEWRFISDENFDTFAGQVDAEEIYRAMKSFLQCPNCGRLWMFWTGYQHDPEEFIPAGGLHPG